MKKYLLYVFLLLIPSTFFIYFSEYKVAIFTRQYISYIFSGKTVQENGDTDYQPINKKNNNSEDMRNDIVHLDNDNHQNNHNELNDIDNKLDKENTKPEMIISGDNSDNGENNHNELANSDQNKNDLDEDNIENETFVSDDDSNNLENQDELANSDQNKDESDEEITSDDDSEFDFESESDEEIVSDDGNRNDDSEFDFENELDKEIASDDNSEFDFENELDEEITSDDDSRNDNSEFDFDNELDETFALDDDSKNGNGKLDFDNDFEETLASDNDSNDDRGNNSEPFENEFDEELASGDESNNKAPEIKSAEDLSWEAIKQNYENKDFIVLKNLLIKYKNDYPKGIYTDNIKQMKQEIGFYFVCLHSEKLEEEIANWSTFLEKYPTSSYIEMVKQKLLFAKGKQIFEMTTQDRESNLSGDSVPDDIIRLVNLSIKAWSLDKKQAFSILKIVSDLLLLESEGKQKIRWLQYYFYAEAVKHFIETNLPKQRDKFKEEAFTVTGIKVDKIFEFREKEFIPPFLTVKYEQAEKMQQEKKWLEAVKIYQEIFSQVNKYQQEKISLEIQKSQSAFVNEKIADAEKLVVQEKYIESIKEYELAYNYANDEQKQVLQQKISKCEEKEFSRNYILAEKFFLEGNLFGCLSYITKAEKFSKESLYLNELKKLIIDKVYKAHENKIKSLIDDNKLSEAEKYIDRIYREHLPQGEYAHELEKYKKFIEICPKIISSFENDEYAKCYEFCQEAIKYYKVSPDINRIYEFITREYNRYDYYTELIKEYIQKGNIEKAIETIEYSKQITKQVDDLPKFNNLWFVQMAKKYDPKFLKAIMYMVPEKKNWVLDMSSKTWIELPFGKKIDLVREYQKAYAKQEYVPLEKIFDIGEVSFSMIFIPPGKFLMGSPDGDADRFADEAQHPVIISEAFWMGKHEVTVKQWFDVTKRKPKEYSLKGNDNLPISHISWNDVQRYFLKEAHQSFSLPTEAEWEYSCRAGTNTRFYWGNDLKYEKIKDYAWYDENTEKVQEGFAHEVGKKKPNAWNLFDMSGNVYEWCQDWETSYAPELQINPKGSKQGKQKIYRGGLWFHQAKYCRSAVRVSYYPDYRGYYVGFRLIRRHIDNNITIAKMGWASASIVEKIMKHVIEKELQIPVKIIKVSGNGVWKDIDSGLIDVNPEVWIPNEQTLFDKYIEKEKTINATLSYRNAFQGFYIPDYAAKEYDIYKIEDLKGKEYLFDLNGDGIGDIWCGIPGWPNTFINEVKVKSYQLLFKPLPLNGIEMAEKIPQWIVQKKPFICYSWDPNPFVEKNGLQRVEEPEYDKTKWFFNQNNLENSKITCGYPNNSVYIIFSNKIKTKHPQAYRFFKNWYFPLEELKKLILRVETYSEDASNLETDKIVKEWISKNPRIVKDWLRNVHE